MRPSRTRQVPSYSQHPVRRPAPLARRTDRSARDVDNVPRLERTVRSLRILTARAVHRQMKSGPPYSDRQLATSGRLTESGVVGSACCSRAVIINRFARRIYGLNRRQQRLARKMSAEVVDHELSDRGPGLDGGAALMRLYDHIGELDQRRRGIRLALEHVERCISQTAVGERRNKRGLVDYAAARNIDERASRAQGIDYGSRDEVTCLRPALAGDQQVIALPRQIDNVRHIFVRGFGFAPRAAVDHAHAEGVPAIGNRAADAAEPEHAHGLAADAAP